MRTMLVTLLAVLFGLLTNPATAADHMRADASTKHPLRIVVAGDSIAAGGGTVSRRFGWPGRLHRRNLAAIDMVNVGHGSSCLLTAECGYPDRLLDTFDKEVLSARPDVIIVAIGRNDLCHMTTSDYIRAAKSLRRKARSAGAEIRFGTITPANERWTWPCEEQAVEINDWLRTLPGTIDFATAVGDTSGQLRRRYDYGDGLHPNGQGHRVMARAAEKALGLRD